MKAQADHSPTEEERLVMPHDHVENDLWGSSMFHSVPSNGAFNPLTTGPRLGTCHGAHI